MAKTLLIIDTNAIAHRAFHAFPLEWTNKDGLHTNAIYGFYVMFLNVLKLFKPDYVIAASDSKGKTFRHDLFQEYKATRSPMDDILREQIPNIIKSMEEVNIPVVEIPKYEADDVIGSLCKSDRYSKYKKIVVTGDKDIFQLIDSDVEVYMAGNPFSKSVLYNETNVQQKLGFSHKNLVEFKAIRGDASDNIPGIAGIGDKIGTEIIKKYSNIDNLYNNLHEFKGKLKEKIESSKDIAYLSRTLAKIKTDLDLPVNLENSELVDIDFEKMKSIFSYYGFKSLMNKVDEISSKHEQVIEREFKKIEVNTVKLRDELMSKLESGGYIIKSNIVKDIFNKPQQIFIGFEDVVYCVVDEFLEDKELLNKIYSAQNITVYDGKNELHNAFNLGVEKFKYTDDLQLLDYLLIKGEKKVYLEDSLFRHLGIKDEQLGQQNLFNTSEEYSQVHRLLLLKDVLLQKLSDVENWDVEKLYRDIELPLTKVLCLMERNGIKLDVKSLQDLSKKLNKKILEVQKEIFDFVGHEFNIASPKQLSDVLYQEIKIPVQKKTKGGSLSTNEKVLMDYINDYPIIKKVLEFREYSKLNSTYTDALIKGVNENTKRIHTTFNQTIVVTGRLSSSNPNLQNIPTNTELGQKIRNAFVADEGKILVDFDYSQQELRLLAHFSEEEKLIESFNNNIDIHATTASHLFNKDISAITKNERRIAKSVNFGVIYGISSFGLADGLKIGVKEAQAFIDKFFITYPKVAVFFKNLIAEGKKNGYVSTIFDRRKETTGLFSSNYQLRMASEREIMNFPLQGSAADITKLAMIRVQEVIDKKYKDFARMILQIHDELLFEVDNNDKKRLDEFRKEIDDVMSEVVKLKIPMLVSSDVGSNWGDLK